MNYDIKIDNAADAKADLTYWWVFYNHYRNGDTFLYNTGPVTALDDPDLNFYQTYDLIRINVDTGRSQTLVDGAIAAPSNVGAASMPGYNANLFDAATVQFGGSANPSYTWVGQSDDPFFLDLRVFDLLYGADLSEVGDDTLAGFNVSAFAVQVPKSRLAARGTPRPTRRSAFGAPPPAAACGWREPGPRTSPGGSSRCRGSACRW